MDVQDLIANYATYGKLFQVRLELYTRPGPGSRIMAELSLVSGRQELWDAYCSVLGYSERTGSNPNEILRELASEELYENFGAQFTRVSRDAFLGAAYALRLVLGETGIQVTPDILECIRGCEKQYDENKEARQRCIEERCLGMARQMFR